MTIDLPDVDARHGAVVEAALVARALTAGTLTYADGATQRFEARGDAQGATTYVENGRPTRGTWHVDAGGQFVSAWGAFEATYQLRWIVEDGVIAGLSFTDTASGSRFDGRYDG
jgi:hypothetical protein